MTGYFWSWCIEYFQDFLKFISQCTMETYIQNTFKVVIKDTSFSVCKNLSRVKNKDTSLAVLMYLIVLVCYLLKVKIWDTRKMKLSISPMFSLFTFNDVHLVLLVCGTQWSNSKLFKVNKKDTIPTFMHVTLVFLFLSFEIVTNLLVSWKKYFFNEMYIIWVYISFQMEVFNVCLLKLIWIDVNPFLPYVSM